MRKVCMRHFRCNRQVAIHGQELTHLHCGTAHLRKTVDQPLHVGGGDQQITVRGTVPLGEPASPPYSPHHQLYRWPTFLIASDGQASTPLCGVLLPWIYTFFGRREIAKLLNVERSGLNAELTKGIGATGVTFHEHADLIARNRKGIKRVSGKTLGKA